MRLGDAKVDTSGADAWEYSIDLTHYSNRGCISQAVIKALIVIDLTHYSN